MQQVQEQNLTIEQCRLMEMPIPSKFPKFDGTIFKFPGWRRALRSLFLRSWLVHTLEESVRVCMQSRHSVIDLIGALTKLYGTHTPEMEYRAMRRLTSLVLGADDSFISYFARWADAREEVDAYNLGITDHFSAICLLEGLPERMRSSRNAIYGAQQVLQSTIVMASLRRMEGDGSNPQSRKTDGSDARIGVQQPVCISTEDNILTIVEFGKPSLTSGNKPICTLDYIVAINGTYWMLD